MNTPTPLSPVDTTSNSPTALQSTAGTLLSGLVGYATALVAAKLNLPLETVTGIFGLVASGAMAIFHHAKK